MRSKPSSVTRRAIAAAASSLALLAVPTLPAQADLGMLSLPAGSRLQVMLEGNMRPKVRALPRKRLAQDFAVLLMRASYAIADDLDFMPMNDFQKNMFIMRQNEWDVYRTELPVTQGDLTDPAYFDFMSFCQYATIADGMRNGQLFFEELIDANGTTAFVRRDSSVPISNALLPELHATRLGDRILNWVDENFPNLAPKVPSTPTAAAILAGVKQIAVVFSLNEFMLQDTLELLPGGGGITWTLVAPATMWSSQVLRVRGDLPGNDFEAKTVLAFMRRCGVPATYTTKYTTTQVTHEFRWVPGTVV